MADSTGKQVTVEKNGDVRVIPAELEKRYTEQLGWKKKTSKAADSR